MRFKIVERNGKYFYEGSDGKLYDEARHFSEGYASVKKGGKWYYVDKEDFKLHGEGYDFAWDFCEGYARVKKGGKWYYVDKEDFKLHGEGYDGSGDFCEGYASVKKGGKWYYVDKEDFKLHGEGYDFAWDFLEGYVGVEKIGVNYRVTYRINKDFQIADEGEALQVAEKDLGIINEIAPECFLAEGFAEALDEIIHKHYTQKIEKIISPDDALKIKEELEKLNKLIEGKKQEVEQELEELEEKRAKLKQAKTDAKETLDRLFWNYDDEKE